MWLTGVTVTGGLAILLYLFSPAESRFYPRCWFFSLTGWQCPGCGGLRAAHQFLHGNFREAFRLNPMLFVLIPGIAFWVILEGVGRMTGRDPVARFRRPVWIWLWVGGLVAFGVLRNVTSAW
jgi:hypothetical protein